MVLESWGRNPKVEHKNLIEPSWLSDLSIPENDGSILMRGLGRSYGDCCLNDGGTLILTKRLNRFIAFDKESGILRAESGVSLREILDFSVCHGWFLPVTPGTKFVTLGGAIANDVHGKNQTKDGSFGRHIRCFELLRSDGKRHLCSKNSNSDLFRATIAGLGLTGIILWAEVQLKPIKGPYIDVETLPFKNLEQFFEITDRSDEDYLYTVAWLDCMAGGGKFGRGVFFRGNHSDKTGTAKECYSKPLRITMPIDCPSWTLNRLSLTAFNSVFYKKNQLLSGKRTTHYDPFFYPLDAVGGWNKIYGKPGFYQFQCVIPRDAKNSGIEALLKTIVDSKLPSFLGVFKCFGELQSPGMLSFPRAGITLCLDFPNQGKVTAQLFRKLHKIVVDLKGAIYPAKDAWMTPTEFEQFYPNWNEFTKFIDPKFSSTLWRRVRGVNYER